jgi:hypothetical protein
MMATKAVTIEKICWAVNASISIFFGPDSRALRRVTRLARKMNREILHDARNREAICTKRTSRVLRAWEQSIGRETTDVLNECRDKKSGVPYLSRTEDELVEETDKATKALRELIQTVERYARDEAEAIAN